MYEGRRTEIKRVIVVTNNRVYFTKKINSLSPPKKGDISFHNDFNEATKSFTQDFFCPSFYVLT